MIEKATPEQWSRVTAAHLLNRAGFGGTPEEIDRFHARGMAKAVSSLLKGKDDSDEFPPPQWVNDKGSDVLAQMREMEESMRDLSEKERLERRQMATRQRFQQERQRLVELTNWWYHRMVNGTHPLRERMALFWHGHFATSFRKVRSSRSMFQQNHVFRWYALGNFRDLAKEVSIDPAMMFYLDTQTSRREMPNENFARELMELFTLGEGQYTEEDIKEAARAFTGYRLNRERTEFIFSEREHDWTEKEFFGRKGNFHGDHIIDIIFEKEQCANFMTRKLWEFFVYEEPADEVIEPFANLFRESHYEIEPLLKAIFTSAEFYSGRALHTQVKSPVDYVVKLSRQLEVDRVNPRLMERFMPQLGQELFHPPNVAGWEGGRTWINTNTLLSRYNLAGILVKGPVGDFDVPGGARNRGRGPAGGDTSRRPDQRPEPGEMRRREPGTPPDEGMRERMREEMQRRMGDRMRGAVARPAFDRIASDEARADAEALVDEIGFRLFQRPLDDGQRQSFVEFAETRAGEGFSDNEVAELMHLMISTPHYQLT